MAAGTRTNWLVSLVSNSIAIALSSYASITYAHYNSFKSKGHLRWFDYAIMLVISLTTAFLIYAVIFVIFGYVPMGKIENPVLTDVLSRYIIPLEAEIPGMKQGGGGKRGTQTAGGVTEDTSPTPREDDS
jgi:hypothetical protein